MRLNDLYPELLLELDWKDRTPIASVLKKNSGKHRFIHFSNSYGHRSGQRAPVLPKLGINPNKIHSDAHGLYFYPVDWLLSNANENLQTGRQYGVNWPDYQIVEIDWAQPGMILSSTSWEEVRKLAERNGWADLLDSFQADPEAFRKANHFYNKPKADTPASVMFEIISAAKRLSGLSLNACLGGLTYIYDDGQSLIDRHEPDQLLVLDKRVIRVVDTGKQDADALNGHSNVTFGFYKHAIVALMQRLRGAYGGDLRWHDRKFEGKSVKDSQRPTLTFALHGATFTLTVPDGGGFRDFSLQLDYAWGRATGRKVFAEIGKIDAATLDADITALVDKVGALSKAKKDLLFTPVLTEKEAQAFIKGHLTSGNGLIFSTAIRNNGQHSEMAVTGTRTVKVGDIAMEVLYGCTVSPTYCKPVLLIRFNDHDFLHVNRSEVASFTAVEGFQPDQFAQAVIERLDVETDWHSPAQKSWRISKFFHEDDFQAFQGWLVENLKLDMSILTDHFANQIEVYHNYKDKRFLDKEIARTMKSSKF